MNSGIIFKSETISIFITYFYDYITGFKYILILWLSSLYDKSNLNLYIIIFVSASFRLNLILINWYQLSNQYLAHR